MWGVIIILAIAVGIVMIEVPYLRKQQLKKELWVFLILLLLGTGLSIAKSLNIDIPNPSDWIAIVLKPLSDVLFSLLE